MTSIAQRARSAMNKLAFSHGFDSTAAENDLHEMFGTRDVSELSDEQAQKLIDHVHRTVGSFHASLSPSDGEPLQPSRDGSRKAKLDPAKIYERWNRRKAGVKIISPAKSKVDEAIEKGAKR